MNRPDADIQAFDAAERLFNLRKILVGANSIERAECLFRLLLLIAAGFHSSNNDN